MLFAGKILIAIGTPPLFAIKILIWTVIWLAKTGTGLVRESFDLFISVGNFFFWLAKTVITAGKDFSKITFKKSRKIKAPKIKLPVLPALPHIPIPNIRRDYLLIFLGFLLAIPLLVVPVWAKTELDQLPDPTLLSNRDIPVSTKIYDRNGILLYQIYSGENRTLVDLNQLPKYVAEATIAIEDKNFYHHLGFDPQGIVRAAFANAAGAPTQGGSTLTQQLVKDVLLTPTKTISRKIKEVILAFWAERIYSKDQILTMYLNQVPYGGAAYGIDAAAQTYFGKSAKDLDLAQTALLAGLPSAPSVYSPFGTHPELAKERQQQVLEAMVNQNYITPAQADAAANEELKFNSQEISIKAPHFVMFVKDYLAQKYGLSAVERGGLEVTTSLDYPTYEAVAKMVADGVAAQAGLNVHNGAALVTDPATGEILAMVGSTDFFNLKNDGNVNVTLANRSPGSSIKPLNYALAFERGLITPATVIDDTRTTFAAPGTTPYTPQNYDNRFHGPVSARVALASSYNVPAVKVLQKNGVDNFIDFAQKLGITTWTDRSRFGLSLTLGGGEVKMTDMATAYSAFANGGNRVDLKPVLEVKDFRSNVLEDNRGNSNRTAVLSPQTAFLISSILSDNSARTPTFGPASPLIIPGHSVAVKTGTTEDKRDNWTIGYTPDLLAAVWVGNNDNSPMSPYLESGNTGAAAIWNPIMSYLLANKPDVGFAVPEGIVSQQICVASESARVEYFRSGTQPAPCNH